MILNRDIYLNKLIEKRKNKLVKVITGIRRCGKSFLLFNLYHSYLNSIGISNDQIIEISLDEIANIKYRNPIKLDKYIRDQIISKDIDYYIFIDEIQKCSKINNPYLENGEKITFVDVLLGLMKIDNVDIYVTGSNSKMLSSDILTEFKGRGDEVKLFPLCFNEIRQFYNDDTIAWNNYILYGGLPFILNLTTHEQKNEYLSNLLNKIYLSDIIERNNLKNNHLILKELLKFICSNVGSLTNPLKLSNTFKSEEKINVSNNTISIYLEYFIESFILNKAIRYDIKGKKYINTPIKYYLSDIGLRNSCIDYRQIEENHIMENIIYNELLIRGFNVDIGVVNENCKENAISKRKQLEIDFIATKGNLKLYIQSSFNIEQESKKEQEIRPFLKLDDSFKKIIVTKNNNIKHYDNNGIMYIDVIQFLKELDNIE